MVITLGISGVGGLSMAQASPAPATSAGDSPAASAWCAGRQATKVSDARQVRGTTRDDVIGGTGDDSVDGEDGNDDCYGDRGDDDVEDGDRSWHDNDSEDTAEARHGPDQEDLADNHDDTDNDLDDEHDTPEDSRTANDR